MTRETHHEAFNRKELRADGGVVEDHNLDLTGAERVEEGQCEYPECEKSADYRVEVESQQTFLACDDCSQKHRLWIKENEVLKGEVTVDE